MHFLLNKRMFFVIVILFPVIISANSNNMLTPLPLSPKETIEVFYNSLMEGNCKKAISIRSGYSIEQCRSIGNVLINSLRIEFNDKKISSLC